MVIGNSDNSQRYQRSSRWAALRPVLPAVSPNLGPPAMTRFLPDRFILALLATVALASLLPAKGEAAVIVGWVSNIAIGLLFFLHGARLSREAILGGLRQPKLHGAVLA